MCGKMLNKINAPPWDKDKHTHTHTKTHTHTHTHTHMCRAYLKEGEVNGEIQEKGRVFKFADFLYRASILRTS